MKNKLSLTIGIPAYNEAKNIKALVMSVQKQKQRRFNLDKIIVYSDASTDNTISEINSLKDKNIHIIEGTKRRGKSYALNQIIDNTNSDILVQIDADILIREKELIENLIDPIIKSKADLTSARVKEYHPKNRLQRILKISMYLKKEIFERINNGNNIYTCHGRARAMSEKLYKSIYFKPEIVAEDAYAYLYVISRNFKYVFANKASVYYLLPKNLKDHGKQSVRFVKSYEQLEEEFGKDLMEKETNIPYSISIPITFKYFFRYPITLFSYFLILIYMKLKSVFHKENRSVWSVARTSKGGYIR